MDVSGVSLNVSSYEQRQKNLGSLRTQYMYFWIQLVVCLIWCTIVICNKDLEDFIKTYFYIGIVCQVIALIIIILVTCLHQAKKKPLNWIFYILFIAVFSYAVSWIMAADPNNLAYFCVWEIFAILIAFLFYSW